MGMAHFLIEASCFPLNFIWFLLLAIDFPMFLLFSQIYSVGEGLCGRTLPGTGGQSGSFEQEAGQVSVAVFSLQLVASKDQLTEVICSAGTAQEKIQMEDLLFNPGLFEVPAGGLLTL